MLHLRHRGLHCGRSRSKKRPVGSVQELESSHATGTGICRHHQDDGRYQDPGADRGALRARGQAGGSTAQQRQRGRADPALYRALRRTVQRAAAPSAERPQGHRPGHLHRPAARHPAAVPEARRRVRRDRRRRLPAELGRGAVREGGGRGRDHRPALRRRPRALQRPAGGHRRGRAAAGAGLGRRGVLEPADGAPAPRGRPDAAAEHLPGAAAAGALRLPDPERHLGVRTTSRATSTAPPAAST